MLCCGYTLTDFSISIRLTSLALWQSNDCPSASKATLMNMDKYFMWIHYERLHNYNKAKHNKTVCIFLGIYCICQSGDHCSTIDEIWGFMPNTDTMIIRFLASLMWSAPRMPQLGVLQINCCQTYQEPFPKGKCCQTDCVTFTETIGGCQIMPPVMIMQLLWPSFCDLFCDNTCCNDLYFPFQTGNSRVCKIACVPSVWPSCWDGRYIKVSICWIS